jgi:type I restriction enzyme M protein
VEASLSHLPQYGAKFAVKPLRYDDLVPAHDLVKIFERFDDLLHQAGHDLEERYEFLLQIILLKIYDEQLHRPKNEIMLIQDFSVMSIGDDDIVSTCNTALSMSLVLYQKYLFKKIDRTFVIRGDTMRALSKILCRLNLLGSSPHVMQDFYMYFARHLYKVDLAQYFTPYEVVEFIVRLANPRFGDSVKDPACGSADFLVAAHRVAQERHNADIADQLYGADDGARAVQISVLNMILNGDGKTNIVKEDSLLQIEKHENSYTLMLCNPPFGKDIVERRPAVLSKFVLAHSAYSGKILAGQETGILFVEVCMRSARPNQRIAIIVPNGYLGNRSERYVALRKWMLCQARIVAIIGFPRFTFKKSGADVSASVLIMEKRKQAIGNPKSGPDYPIHFNLLNRVGWDVRNKRAERVYQMSDLDGSLILNEDNEPIIDADFDRVAAELYRSPVIDAFPWLTEGVESAGVDDGWAVYSSEILDDPAMILDPKRYCQKYRTVVSGIKSLDHFRLGEVLDFVNSKFKKKTSESYRYVEIDKIYENFGAYEWEDHRGWNLPGRAKLLAKPGDIFVAKIWSSVGKWFIAGADAAKDDLVVTSGCYHLRLKAGKGDFLTDIVYGFSTEMFRVQMRALATGSDGLSVISEDDFGEVILPRVPDKGFRAELDARVSGWTESGLPLARFVEGHLKTKMPTLDVPVRSSHVAQV